VNKLLIALCLVSAVGCKQGLGEHCQVSSDCSSGLVCNQASMVCANTGMSGGIDAEVPIMIDASIDASIDAPIDAIDAPAR
jgi:hypothetical protein